MVIRLRLFLIAYAPMFAIVAALNWPSAWKLSLSCWCVLVSVLMCVLGVLDALNLILSGRRVSPLRFQIREVQDAGSMAAGFAATYLFPFLSTDISEIRSVLGYLLFLGVLLLISLRSPLGLVSPTLYLLGWRVFLVRLDGHDDLKVLIAQTAPSPGERRLLAMSGGYRTMPKGRH